MKKLFLVLAMLLFSATCYGWSDNDYPDEHKAAVEDVIANDDNANGIPDTTDGGGGLADAPSDGTEYLRKDGAWAHPTSTAGADGEAVLLQVADGYIQWKYASDVLWTNLIATADLEGDPGTPGVDGDDGTEITLQVADGYIQWSYVGSGSWTNLIATADLIGATGADGTDGFSVLSVAGVPGIGAGVDGDYCINTLTHDIYGPKTAGEWGSPTSLIGPQGIQGETGATGAQGIQGVAGVDGTDGVDGNTILYGTIDPTTEGVDGDFYINTAANTIFGPKATTWPSGVSLVGPAGSGATVDLTTLQNLVTNDFHNLGGTDAVDDADHDPTNEIQDLSGYMEESNIGTGANNYIQLSAAPGTPNGTLFLRDDGTWVLPTDTDTDTDDQTAAEVPYTNTTSGLSATDTQAAIDEVEGRVDTNDAKVSNVSTALAIGTKTATTLAVTSDGGADDVVLPEADTDNAGLLGADKWDEIVANTAKVTFPGWSNFTLTSQAIGDIFYADSTTTITRLADVAAGQPLLSGGVTTAPAYAGYTLSGTAAQTYIFPSTSATLAKLSGNTFTGTHDFGGADDLEVPNGANPTVDTAGQIAVDSSAAPGSGIRFYGDAAYTLAGTYRMSITILSPVATDDGPYFGKLPYAITIKTVAVQCIGGTNIVGMVTECDGEGINPAVVDSSDITATANNSVDDDGTLSNPSIDANDYVGWKTESISGTPTSVTVTFDYIINQTN